MALKETVRNVNALNTFRHAAKKAKPTKAHRPALWENMLGTVYASNGHKTQYFDYDYAAAIAFIGPHTDVRVARADRNLGTDYQGPERGKLVWWVVSVTEPWNTPAV